MGNNRQVALHDIKCVNGTNGVALCDVIVDEPTDKITMDGVLDKARQAWQAKLDSITEYTKDFNEVSKRIFDDVLCDVRYVYRTNQTA